MRKTDVLMSMTKRLVEREEYARAARTLEEMPPADGAQTLAGLGVEAMVEVFAQLEAEPAGDILAEMSDELRTRLLERLGPEQIAEVVEEMPSDEATDVLQDMEPQDAEEVMAGLEPETRADIAELAGYHEETAGGIMAKEFATVPAWVSAAQATEVLRREFQDVEDLNTVYAVDEEERLVGSCSLRDLVMAPPGTRVGDLVERHHHWVQEQQDQEEVAHYMRLHDLDAVAVVDDEGRVLGQVTLNDATDVMDEEATEDLHRVSGITADEPVFGPLRGSLARRLPWLLINLPLALVAASVARAFADTVSSVPAIVAYLPVIGGVAGNAAGQTVAVFVRGLAVGEVTFADMGRSLWGQSRIGITVGAALGLLVAVVAALWEKQPALIGVVGLALLLNCVMACFVGAFLPLVLRRLGWDPAMGANLVTTSITDASGYAFLLGTATLAVHLGWVPV